MFSGLNRAVGRIPVIVRMTLLSAFFFMLLLGSILLVLNKLMEREWKKQNRNTTDLVAATVRSRFPDLEKAEESLVTGTVQFALYSSPDEKQLYSTRRMPVPPLTPLNTFFSLHDGGIGIDRGFLLDGHGDEAEDGRGDGPDGPDWAVQNRILVIDGQEFILQVAVNREAEYLSDDLFGTLLTALIPLVLAAAFLSTYISQRRSLKQIERISRAAEEISASRLDRKIPETGARDELGRLTRQFNRMIDRLRRGMEEQKRFTADASHELRTPLASLSGYVNMLERWGMEDPEIRKEAVSVIRKECTYMNRLIENLLMLSRLDDGTLDLSFGEFNARRLLDTVKERMEWAFPDREVRIDNRISGPVYGNPEALEQVLQILVENSFLYDTSRSPVTLMAGRKGSGTYLIVKDRGPGIPEEERQNVFKRFYRIDKVRTRESGGTGLGLSLAGELVRLHGGKIRFCPRQTGALCLIQLPGAEKANGR